MVSALQQPAPDKCALAPAAARARMVRTKTCLPPCVNASKHACEGVWAGHVAPCHAMPLARMHPRQPNRDNFYLYVKAPDYDGDVDVPVASYDWYSADAAHTGSRGLLVNISSTSSQNWHVQFQASRPVATAAVRGGAAGSATGR